MSTTVPITIVDWSNLTHLKLPTNYKLQSLETEDHDALFAVYKCLYPEQSKLVLTVALRQHCLDSPRSSEELAHKQKMSFF